MPLNAVVVPNSLRDRVERFTGREVETDDVTFRGFVLLVGAVVSFHCEGREGTEGRKGETHLKSHHRILHIQPSINRQRLRDRQQRVRERLNSKFRPPLRSLLSNGREVLVSCDFEATGTGDEGTVFEGVFDRAETVTDRVGRLGDGVGVGTCGLKAEEGRGSGGRRKSVSSSEETAFSYVLPRRKKSNNNTKERNAPLTNKVTLFGSLTSSTNVNFSSPRVCS
jgi:hypothetical protein